MKSEESASRKQMDGEGAGRKPKRKALVGVNRAEFKVLERIFAHEIGNMFPCQFRSKHLPELVRRGYIQEESATLEGRFPVTIKGWGLTHRGHLMYCQNCTQVEEPCPPPQERPQLPNPVLPPSGSKAP